MPLYKVTNSFFIYYYFIDLYANMDIIMFFRYPLPICETITNMTSTIRGLNELLVSMTMKRVSHTHNFCFNLILK